MVDIIDYNLSIYDETLPPIMGKYENKHTQLWSQKISEFDGFIFVTPEYNHSIPGALKNAIDFLYTEWNNKSAGFISYGASGGIRAIEHLRAILSEVQIAHVKAQVSLSLYSDFNNFNSVTPRPYQLEALQEMFAQVILWANALKDIREKH